MSNPEKPIDENTLKAIDSEMRQRVLRALTEKRMTQSELAAKLGISEPSMSRHVKHLHEAQLIQRKEEGRKWKYFELTQKGHAVLHPQSAYKPLFRFIPLLIALILIIAALLVAISDKKEVITQPLLDEWEKLKAIIEPYNASTTTTTSTTLIAVPPTLNAGLPPVTTTTSTTTTTFVEERTPETTTTTLAILDFEMELSPITGRIETEEQIEATLSVSSAYAQEAPVQVSVLYCPRGAECSLSINRSSLPFLTQVAVNSGQASAGNYSILIVGERGVFRKEAFFSLEIFEQQGRPSNGQPFTLNLSERFLNIPQGESRNTTLILNVSQAYEFAYSDCITMASCEFVQEDGATLFIIRTTNETPRTAEKIMITARAGEFVEQKQLMVRVQ